MFVLAQGGRRGGLFHQGRDFPTWWGPREREGRDASRGRRSWLGCRIWGAGGLSGRKCVRVWLVRNGRRCTGVGGALNLYSLQVEGGEEVSGEGELLLYWRVPVPQALGGEHVEEDGGQIDAACQEEVVDVSDTQHVGGDLLSVLHIQPEDLVEVGEYCLVAGRSVGGEEDGDHFETFSDEIIAGVKVRRGITGDQCVDGGAELATLDDVGCVGFELGRAWREGGNIHSVGEGEFVIKPVLGGSAERLELETVGRSPDGNGGCGSYKARVDKLVNNVCDVVRGQYGGGCGGGHARGGTGGGGVCHGRKCVRRWVARRLVGRIHPPQSGGRCDVTETDLCGEERGCGCRY